MTATEEISNLSLWTKKMCEVELPALSATVLKIRELSQDDDCAVQALAELIAQDAAMTAYLMRLTSSAYHVPTSRTNTITRALVILGFQEVQTICLSIAVIDNIISKSDQSQFVKELATAFHAAVQAEQISCSIGDRFPQEVFLATLLYSLGRLLFWCFGGEKRSALLAAMNIKSAEEAEREVLGFELRELTAELARRWGLGQLLIDATSGVEPQNDRVKAVRLGHSVAQAIESGKTEHAIDSVIANISAITGMSQMVLSPMLKSTTAKAQEVAVSFRAEASAVELAKVVETIDAPKDSPAEDFRPCEPDQNYQLQILRELSLKLESLPEVNEVVALALDGIFRGIGMDRVMFAILSPNRKYLMGKFGFGSKIDDLIGQFKFPLDASTPHIFSSIVEGQQAIWVSDQSSRIYSQLISPSVKQVVGSEPFFIAPTIVTGKPIGIIFADRFASKRQLDANLFQSFKQFAITVNISLEHLKMMHAASARASKGSG